ncbi:MAG: hypothetical protein AAGF51_11965 [Pseudomonadota bacterium]
MFSFDDLLKDATDMVGGPDQRNHADFGDIAQALADSGLNLGALAAAPRDQAETAMREAGLDPALLDHPKVAELMTRLRGDGV